MQGRSCQSCGSKMRYHAGRGELICGHCGASAVVLVTPEPIATHSYLSALETDNDLPQIESHQMGCTSCGARFDVEATLKASACPYCATPILQGSEQARHIAPDGIIPFMLGEAAAQEALKSWLKSLWFAPNGLAQYARNNRSLRGVYAPYWAYDADTQTQYSGQRGEVYYVQTGKNQRQRRVRWWPASGRVRRRFEDLLILASNSLPSKQAERLTQWQLGALTRPREELILGFDAETYALPLDAGFARAQARMEAVITTDIKRDIGGDEQRITARQTQYRNIAFKHLLLPIWVGVYRYRGQVFQIVVNGQSGEVQGARPWSWIKIALAAITALLIAGALYALAQNG